MRLGALDARTIITIIDYVLHIIYMGIIGLHTIKCYLICDNLFSQTRNNFKSIRRFLLVQLLNKPYLTHNILIQLCVYSVDVMWPHTLFIVKFICTKLYQFISIMENCCDIICHANRFGRTEVIDYGSRSFINRPAKELNKSLKKSNSHLPKNATHHIKY